MDRPYIKDLFSTCQQIIQIKAHDYSRPDNPHSSFDYAHLVAHPFSEDLKPYATLIATKLARIAELTSTEKGTILNESLKDTIIDLINYCALMGERIEGKAYGNDVTNDNDTTTNQTCLHHNVTWYPTGTTGAKLVCENCSHILIMRKGSDEEQHEEQYEKQHEEQQTHQNRKIQGRHRHSQKDVAQTRRR